ncbi:hypothetical protein CHS0354_025481 [Potamilus streckersoni]|uniref:dihydrofolate reductase n=1 Tax=Potamilus streckersoni TaxID=2493646 RepID=A0AAE0RRX0_9BIVA|nr:hypothetical protein CHS0354_025481 [Potamilus streckersoni]
MSGDKVEESGTKTVTFDVMVAMSDNRGIGNKLKLPWPTIKKDFEYYVERVQRKSIDGKRSVNIRGRLTWDCTQEVEKYGVYNIVISKSMKDSGQLEDPKIQKVCASVQEAIDYCSSPPFCDEIGPVWIMGGAQVYEEAINHPQCRYIFVTHIYRTFEADTFFPKFEEQYEEISLDDVDGSLQQDNGLMFQFKVYKKKSVTK